MLLLGDKGCKSFKATQEIKVQSFRSATGVPCDLGQITLPRISTISPMTQQQLPSTKLSNYGNTRETLKSLKQPSPSVLILKSILVGIKLHLCHCLQTTEFTGWFLAQARRHPLGSEMEIQASVISPLSPVSCVTVASYLTLPCLSFCIINQVCCQSPTLQCYCPCADHSQLLLHSCCPRCFIPKTS